MKLLHTYAICVFCGFLCVAECFAASDNEPSNSVRTATPASIPEPEPSAIPVTSPEKDTELLVLVRQVNEVVYSDLQSFVCNEEMRRFQGRISRESGRAIDTVTAKVSFENGVEHYTDIRQKDVPRPAISDLGGAWSTGEFGTLLRQTQDLLKTQPVLFRSYAEVDGTPAAVYSVDISEQDSPWDLEIRSVHFHIPFRTDVWVSRASGEIVKIERVSTGTPPRMGISEVRWGVTLRPVEMNGKTWLLPNTGDYMVMYEASRRREWNEMSFSNYRRYGSEVALRFQ